MEIVKGLYGSEFDKSRACAYCREHHCYLQPSHVNKRNCLGKQCWHLEKEEGHPWWHQREIKKQKRRERKKKLEAMFNVI